jgi:hypothetical protein
MQMNSIELEVFAKQATKGIKIHQDLNEFSLLAVATPAGAPSNTCSA